MLKRKDPELVENARRAAEAESARFAGCCELCETPEDCKANRVPCELSGEMLDRVL